MTMYLIAGDGDMPARELTKTLESLAENDKEFGLAVLDREATGLDKKVENFGFDGELEAWPRDEIAQIIEEFNAEEPVALLAVFVNPNEEDSADDDLVNLIITFQDAGFAAFAFNDGMALLDTAEEDEPVTWNAADEPEEEAEAEEEPEAKTEEETSEDLSAANEAVVGYTRDELEALSLKDLRALAASQGIEWRSRLKEDYIAGILKLQDGGDASAEVAEVAEVAEQEVQPGNVLATAIVVIHLEEGFITLRATREQVADLISSATML